MDSNPFRNLISSSFSGDMSEDGIDKIQPSEVDMIPAVVAMPGMSEDIDVVSCISNNITEDEIDVRVSHKYLFGYCLNFKTTLAG